ncbi:MAG: FkbM family methyltransferase [Acutalibacter sp.]|jgi:FkbM family methyltransferase
MPKPLLSIGMIVKDEIRCLQRCLDSLKPLRDAIPCQLVIADTGSTDGTRELAEKSADVLVDFPWIGDFAAARNAAMERCEGEWYLTVDADEWLEDIEPLVTFLKSEDQKKFDYVSSIQRNYQDKELKNYGDFFVARMGRLREGTLRYQSPIHETLFYTDGHQGNAIVLQKLILHHDGYLSLTPEHMKEKRRRNMPLLRAELEKKPEDLRLLVHCLQSADDKDERRDYVERSLAIAPREKANPYCSVSYQNAMMFYSSLGENSKVLECYDAWQKLWPDSPLLAVDGEAIAAVTCYRMERYETALAHLRRNSKGLERVEKEEDMRSPDRMYTQYNTTNDNWKDNLQCIGVHCQLKLEHYDQAQKALDRVKLETTNVGNRVGLVLSTLASGDKLPRPEEFLKRCWQLGQDLPEDADKEERERWETWHKRLLAIFRQEAIKDPEKVIPQLAGLEGTSVGVSAKICLADNAALASALWEQIRDWEDVLPQAYLHTMDLRCPLPQALYGQNSETLAELASFMGQQKGFARTVGDWISHQPPVETPGQLTWQLDLLMAALRCDGWQEDEPLAELLCGLYASLSQTYLENVYNPEILNREDLSVLPGMQRYAWFLWQARKAGDSGDELGYVRNLRAALETAPAMKNMVEYLLHHKPQPAPSQELLQLAQKVREILAQYPEGHPAVEAIKASEAYQKVASLLEPPQQAAVEKPCAPEPMEEDPKLRKNFFELFPEEGENLEEVIRSNFAKKGNGTDQWTDYWNRFPLWGKGKNEVLHNAAVSLTQHKEDFFWLFDRLGDTQSRRVLDAVIRSWRNFEILPLESVIDHTYSDYFDLSLVHCDDQEVVADVGAFIGDTFLSYIKAYGSENYLRYYAYEITQKSFETLKKNTEAYPRVLCRRKGAGSKHGVMKLDPNESDASANQLSQQGKDEVEIVALDEDITEPLTFIKMDIEGAEYDALLGCQKHICQDHPKLALSVYHNFEDLWRLARVVDQWVPGYRFFLRYHGGNLWPSEITLLALPPEA